MYTYVLFSVKDPAAFREILEFPRIARPVLPPGLCETPIVKCWWGRFVLFAWYRDGDHNARARALVNPGVISSKRAGYIFCGGYAGPDMLGSPNEKQNILSLIRVRGEEMRLWDSPGGVGSYVWISPSERTAVAWSTQPPAMTTFVAKNHQSFCVVGNRPRLTYCASALSSDYQPDRSYFTKYLVSAFGIDGSTLYPNTRAVPPDQCCRLVDGEHSFADYPLPPAPRIAAKEPLEKKSERLAQLLVEACWPVEQCGEAALLLSGGKDSRTIAAALKTIGAPFSSYHFGNEESREGEIAREVARRLGSPFEFKTTRAVMVPEDAAALTNAATDGLGIAFAHQYNHAPPLDFTNGHPTFHGHGHLLRGGFARTMNRKPAHVHATINRAFFSAFTRQPSWMLGKEVLDAWNWRREWAFADKLDVLFYANQDFRLGQFSAPSMLDLGVRAFMVYPLLDERVARFAAGLSVFDRVSERVVFGALRQLHPQLANMPLYGEMWHFDQFPERTDFIDSNHNFQAGFDLRQPQSCDKLRSPAERPAIEYDHGDRVRRRKPGRVIAEFLLQTTLRRELQDSILPEVSAEIAAQAKGSAPSDYVKAMDRWTRFNFDAFLKRAFVGASLYDLGW